MKFRLWLVPLLVLNLMGAASAEKKDLDDNNLAAYLQLFNQVLEKIQTGYYDTEKIRPGTLIRAAIDGMLDSLDDQYTRLMVPEDYKDMQVKTQGKFGGVGMVIEKEDTAIRIVYPIAGTPAFNAGLQPGDLIIAIEDQLTDTMDVSGAADLLRGTPGTEVRVTAMHGKKKFDLTLKRATIPIESVTADVIDTALGIHYLRVKDFTEHSARDVEQALKDLASRGLAALILDLRNNPGGLLESASDISDLFVDTGLLVYTKGRLNSQNRTFPASARNDFTTFPVVVVTNGHTASGAEILAGAIRDSGRGVIVGTRTFGKGVVQSVYDHLILDYAVTVTTATYYTPSGAMIHKKGTPPDIEVEQPPIPKEIQEALYKIRGEDIILEFSKNRESFAESDVKDIVKTIQSKKMEVPEPYIRYLLKEQFMRKKGKNVVFDLDTDIQLQRAMQIASTFLRVYKGSRAQNPLSAPVVSREK